MAKCLSHIIEQKLKVSGLDIRHIIIKGVRSGRGTYYEIIYKSSRYRVLINNII